jgi:hypothetical protein
MAEKWRLQALVFLALRSMGGSSCVLRVGVLLLLAYEYLLELN